MFHPVRCLDISKAEKEFEFKTKTGFEEVLRKTIEWYKQGKNMRKDTKNFIAFAEYDLQTAEYMLNTGRYIYVVFMCHLSIEKILKAIVAEVIKKIPPKTHNLIYLIKLAKVSLSQELFEFVTKINNVSVVTRYPEDFSKLLEVYPKYVAEEYLTKTKEVILCLKENEKLKKLGINAEKIILYGSYAKGNPREESDIDLIVISKDFEKLNLRERLEILGLAAGRILEPIEALGYTKKEIESKGKESFVGEILNSMPISY